MHLQDDIEICKAHMDLKGSDSLTNKPLSQARYEQNPWVLDSLQSHSDVN